MHKTKVNVHSGPLPRQPAFSLVEVLVGTCVMTIVFASIFATLTMSLSTTELSRENLRATQIMLDKMEVLRLYTPTQLTNTTLVVRTFTNWQCETNNIGMPDVQGYGVQYTGSIAITNAPFAASYSSNMQQVTVNLSWVSGGQDNFTHTRSVSTFYANQGLANYISTH